MKHRGLTILGILCTSLILRADSGCVSTRVVEQAASVDVVATWQTAGWTEANYFDEATVDAAAEVRTALEDNISGTVESIRVAGATYLVLENSGHLARRAGGVSVDGRALLGFDVPDNDTGRRGSASDPTLTLEAEGVNYINAQLDTWLTQYIADPATADDSLLEFTYSVQWSSTPPPSSTEPDAFTWTTSLVLHVVGEFEVEVPDL